MKYTEEDVKETVNETGWWNDCYVRIPTPKTTVSVQKDWVPLSLLISRSIQGVESRRLLRVLFDSGGTNILIHSKCLPKGASPVVLKDGPTKLKTMAGDFVSTPSTYLKDLVLPEFDKTRRVEGIRAFIFDAPCNYI
jgi:hypothetical protein